MIRSVQIRAARALLAMSQQDFATQAAVGLNTVKRIEAVGEEPTGTIQTLLRIKRALELAGILFIDQDEKHGPGVRLRKPQC